MHRNSVYIFALITLLFSCEEDEESVVTYPSIYYKARKVSSENLRVFSNKGEIKNSSIVSRFTQYDTAYYRSYSNYIGNEPGVMDNVYFLDGQNAILNHEDSDLDCLLTRENSLLVLTETNAASKCCTYGEAITHSLSYYLGKTKPEVISESIYSSVRGNYNFGYMGREKYVFTETQGQLIAPMILYSMHSGYFDTGFVNDLLQPDFYTKLATGDTVTIMEFKVLFEK